MKLEEFLQDKTSPTPPSRGGEPSRLPSRGGGLPCPPSDEDEPLTPEPEEEIEIQKAVVESLAADKVKIEEEATLARSRIAALEGEVASLKAELARSADRLAFHPCDNTETLVLSTHDFFQKYLPATGHEPTFGEVHDFEEEA